MPANEKRRYMMTSDLRQYIVEYTVANFLRYPIRRRVTYASALEWGLIIVSGQEANGYNLGMSLDLLQHNEMLCTFIRITSSRRF